jgi:S1-C subfamily serine protease
MNAAPDSSEEAHMSKFWRHFISNGCGGRTCGKLGFQGHAVPLLTPLPRGDGVEVWEVEPGGPADQAGMMENDIIVMVADQPALSVDHLHGLLRQQPGGIPVPVRFLRGEQQLQRWVLPANSANHYEPRV